MRKEPTPRGFPAVCDGQDRSVRQLNLALVANLPAALGVERRGVEHHLDRFPRRRRLHADPVVDDGANRDRLLHEGPVAGELGGRRELVRDRGE